MGYLGCPYTTCGQDLDEHLGLIALPAIPGIVGGVLPKLPIIGGIFVKGRCPGTRPGFPEAMCRNLDDDMFFRDRRGEEWSTRLSRRRIRSSGPPDRKYAMPGSPDLGSEWTAAPRYLVEDWNNLLTYGTLQAQPGGAPEVPSTAPPGAPAPTKPAAMGGMAIPLLLGGLALFAFTK